MHQTIPNQTKLFEQKQTHNFMSTSKQADEIDKLRQLILDQNETIAQLQAFIATQKRMILELRSKQTIENILNPPNTNEFPSDKVEKSPRDTSNREESDGVGKSKTTKKSRLLVNPYARNEGINISSSTLEVKSMTRPWISLMLKLTKIF